jgi:LmbE family N-acetylglucosaminyl deacetylase
MISGFHSRIWSRLAGLAVLGFLFQVSTPAQRNITGAVRTRLALEQLNVLGNVLMVGAHPDDENTGMLAYLARGRHTRAAYLSATRGDGGQNLIGPEQGDMLGLIRTQELLAARRVDGAEQFFTRAVDFGFSKSAAEALSKWDRGTVLSDIVWTIRRFRPDVVIIQHSGTPADGHGHHQAIGILGREAFSAAADRTRFPEQLRWVEPWQAKRLMGRGGGGTAVGTIAIDTGNFDPVLGFSYSEIAGMSRSMHKSQGMGAPEQRGASRSFLAHIAGNPAVSDIFDGIDTTWNRVAGGAAAGKILEEAARTFLPDQPEKTIPLFLKARPLVAALKDPQAVWKLRELDEAIALFAGLWLDASADRHAVAPGESLQVNIEAINRSRSPLALKSVKLEGVTGAPEADFASVQLAYNEPQRRSLTVAIWDPQYQPLFESHDPGEEFQKGGTLYARYGKGAYIFSAFSWFRQLPAGVPGAFRIFANFLSAAKSGAVSR